MPRITELGLKALAENDVGRTLYDEGGLRGEVRVGEGGVIVAFSFRYRFDGKIREVRCGTWPRLTLKQIRAARDEHNARLREGVDPGLARQVARAEKVNAQRQAAATLKGLSARPTLRQVFEEWHRREASKRADGGAEIRRAFEKDVLPTIGELYADDIARRHVLSVLDDVKERAVRRYANLLLQYLRQLFRFAAIREIVKGDPTFGIRKKDAGGIESPRERYLTEKEIRELASKLPASGLSIGAVAGIWIMLSTCCRVGELSRARWSDIDWAERTWTIPKEHAKNGRAHVVHLSDFSLAQFRKVHDGDESAISVFAARTGDGHRNVKALQKQYYDRLRETPLKGRTQKAGTLLLSGGVWRAHDLRRTGATLMGELGVRSDVIERCLNHIGDDKLRTVYQRQELVVERREAFRRLGERLELLRSPRNGIVTGEFRRKSA